MLAGLGSAVLPAASATAAPVVAPASAGLTSASGIAAGVASPRIGPVRADTSDFEFSSFTGDYYLSRHTDGRSTMRTVETFVATFPETDQNKGMVRAIPNDYDGVPLNTTLESVSDSEGNTKPYSVDTDGDFTTIELGTDDYVHGNVTYTITYTQDNVVRAFTDTNDDELYWDTNGTGFEQPFGRVTARVHVDPTLVPALTGKMACYYGAQGSSDTCEIRQAGVSSSAPSAPATTDPGATPTTPATPGDEALITATVVNLTAGENLTVAIGFTLGTFEQVPANFDGGTSGDGSAGTGSEAPAFGEDVPIWSTVLALILAILSAAGVLFSIVYRVALGPKDAKGRGIIIPQYSVPKGINLIEAGALLERRANSGISAQLVSFAVRGNIRILDYPVTASGAEFTLQLVHANNVDVMEKWMLGSLFGTRLEPGAVREIGVTDDPLATAFSSLRISAGKQLEARGLRKSGSSRGGVLIAVGIVALLVVSILVAIITGVAGIFSPWLIAALVVSFFGLFVSFSLSSRGPVLTDAGAEMRDYLIGMREYLQLAEANRFRMLQSPDGAERINVGDQAEVVKLYEKLLPFAVLWGVEKEWAKELAAYYDTTSNSPAWFIGTDNTFSSLLLLNAISGFGNSVQTSATPTPPPPSSSWSGSGGGSFSGGSGGGGFSGGGGGGGGGGGR